MATTQLNGGTQIRTGTITQDRFAAFTADLSLANNKITNVGTPSAGTDAANKSYVDAAVQGFDWKASVRAASTANVTLASAVENGDTIDGVTLATGDRVLLKNQSTGAENGVYTVNASGPPTRATDADSSADVTAGLAVFVSEGTANGNTQWILTTDDPITLGTTALTFTQVGSGAGSVSTVSVTSANGFAGSVSNASTTPAITISTTVTGLLKGNGTAVSAATSGTDYAPATAGTGILKGNNAGGFSTAAAGTDYLAPSSRVTRETPSGSINGSNTAYTLANTPIAGTEEVYLNGILQEPGAGNDYTISAATITYLTAPVSGDKLRVSYFK